MTQGQRSKEQSPRRVIFLLLMFISSATLLRFMSKTTVVKSPGYLSNSQGNKISSHTGLADINYLQRHLQNMNNTAQKINQPNAIIYNRVPKTGSRVVKAVMEKMGHNHKFKLIASSTFLDFRPSRKDLLRQVSALNSAKRPWLFDRHIYFFRINQTRNDIAPLYINIVREPVSRCISWYYFIRYEHPRKMSLETRNRSFDACMVKGLDECTQMYQAPYRCLQMPFFCGQDEVCVTQSRVALEIAMRNVVKEYEVVGIMEDMRSFFKVVDKQIPQFFSGALSSYDLFGKQNQKKYSNKKHANHSESTAVRMKDMMSLEIEFYKFVKELFYSKHRSVLDT